MPSSHSNEEAVQSVVGEIPQRLHSHRIGFESSEELGGVLRECSGELLASWGIPSRERLEEILLDKKGGALPPKRYGHLMLPCAAHSRYFIIHGGTIFEDRGSQSRNDMWLFDAHSRQWVALGASASLRYHAGLWLHQATPSALAHTEPHFHASALLRDMLRTDPLLFLGGKDSLGNRLPFVTTHSNAILSKIPQPVSSVGVVIDKDQMVWAFGGAAAGTHSDILMCAPLHKLLHEPSTHTTNHWTLMNRTMEFLYEESATTVYWPSPRAAHVMLYSKPSHSIIVYGGKQTADEDSVLNDLWIYSCHNKSWSFVKQKHNSPWPEARYHHAACLTPDSRFMVLFGGALLELACNDCWIFDIELLRWHKVHLQGDVPSPRMNMSMTILQPTQWCNSQDAKTCLYIFGGADEEEEFSDLFEIPLETPWGQTEICSKRRQHRQIRRIAKFFDVQISCSR